MLFAATHKRMKNMCNPLPRVPIFYLWVKSNYNLLWIISNISTNWCAVKFLSRKRKNGDSWATDLPSKGLSPVLRDYTNVAASQDIHGQPPWKSKQARKTPGGPRKAAGQAGDFHLGDQMWKWFLGMSINDVIAYKLYIIYSYISILIPKYAVSANSDKNLFAWNLV